MLRFLTQKFRAQSLNEVRPVEPQGPLSCFVDECGLQDEIQDERDENDNEQSAPKKEQNKNHTEANDNFVSATSTPQNAVVTTHQRFSKEGKLSSERNLESHKHSSDLVDHSVTPREPAEKRKWSQMNIATARQILSQINTGGGDSSSSDDEIKELCARRPKAILLSSSPPDKMTLHSAPHGCSYITTRCPSRLGTGHHGHIRKRHRLQPFGEDFCRPSLDFEKMQQKTVFRKQQHNGIRPRIVKIRSISTSGFTPNLDPEVLSFKPITQLKPFNLAPVEEPHFAF